MKTAGRRMPRPVEPSGTRVSAWGYTKMVRFYLKDAPAAVAEGRIFRSGSQEFETVENRKVHESKIQEAGCADSQGGSVTRYIPRHERNIPQPTPHTRPQFSQLLTGRDGICHNRAFWENKLHRVQFSILSNSAFSSSVTSCHVSIHTCLACGPFVTDSHALSEMDKKHAKSTGRCAPSQKTRESVVVATDVADYRPRSG